MIEDTSQNTPDARSFEDKVFVRFDALDARIKKLESTSKRSTFEKFKNIAAGVQSVVLALGVLIGGLWTYYTFGALRARYKAEAEIRQLELANRVQGVIDIEIKAEQVSTPNDTGRSINIDIQVKNLGNRNLKLELPNHALTIAKVKPDNEGHLYIEWFKNPTIPYLDASKLISRDLKLDNSVKPTPPELLRAGQTVAFPCWFRVEEAGLYLIDFEGALTGEDLKISQQETGQTKQFNVTAQTFIVVK
jgi:hypothetical protein